MTQFGKEHPGARQGHTATGDGDGGVYVFGGFGEMGFADAFMWRFDVATGEWERLAENTGGPLTHHVAGYVPGPNPVVLMFGGEGTGAQTSRVVLYDVVSDGWTDFPGGGPQPPTRILAAGTTRDESLFVFGGEDSMGGLLDDSWKFSTDDLSWETRDEMPAPLVEGVAANLSLPPSRGAAPAEGILVFGGLLDEGFSDRTLVFVPPVFVDGFESGDTTAWE